MKLGCDNGIEAKDGAKNVLIFWPNLRLAVLIVLVLIKKKACIFKIRLFP